MAAQLILDASSSVIQVGIWEEGVWLSFKNSQEHALECLFSCVADCLREAQLQLKDLNGIIYCEGPGSILGIRLVAMAIRTWKTLPELQSIPIYAYQSFAFVEAVIKTKFKAEVGYIISPSRNKLWNVFEDGKFKELSEAELVKLSGKSVWMMPQRALARECPVEAKVFEYDLKGMPAVFLDQTLYAKRTVIDAINTGDQQFVKWTGERHQ